jgi:hypothetical protein
VFFLSCVYYRFRLLRLKIARTVDSSTLAPMYNYALATSLHNREVKNVISLNIWPTLWKLLPRLPRLLIFLFAVSPLRVYRVFLSRTITFSRFVRYRSRPCNVIADVLHTFIMRFFLYALPFPGIFTSSDLQLFQIYLPDP